MIGNIIVGHGSRSKDAVVDFNYIIEILKGKLPNEIIEGAHMELASPSIEESIDNMILHHPKIKVINIIPYFLYTGIHIKEDIPQIIQGLREEYPKIIFKMSTPFGRDPILAEILLKKIEELKI